jgi:hypothetical protein
MMTFARNLWRDLVDKRLVPVVAVLVAALVAVPILIGSGSSKPKTSAAPPPAAAAPDAGVAAAVSLNTSTSSKETHRPGKLRNPFKPKHTTPDAGPTGAAGPSLASSGPSASSSSSAGPSKPSSSKPSSTTVTPTAGVTKDYFQWFVDIRMGSHEAMKTHRNVHGVTPLPSTKFVLLTFIGVGGDNESAAFDVSPGSMVKTDGKCLPSETNCSVLLLKKDESALLTRHAGSTGYKRYRVRVQSVALRKATKDFTQKASAASVHGASARSVQITTGASAG